MPTPYRPITRSRWTEDDARAVLMALERSGKSVRAFAEERGLDPHRLYVWRRRVAGGDRTMFREVAVGPRSAGTESIAAFEVAPLS